MVEDRGAEAGDQEVVPAVVVVIEKNRVGDDRARVVAAAHPRFLRHVGEVELAVLAYPVIVQEVVSPAFRGVGEEEVLPAVVIVVGDRHRGAARGKHTEGRSVFAGEGPGVMNDPRAGR